MLEKITTTQHSITILGQPGKDNVIVRKDVNGIEYFYLSFKQQGGSLTDQIGKINRIIRADREPMIFDKLVEQLEQGNFINTDEVTKKDNNWFAKEVKLVISRETSADLSFYDAPTPGYYPRNNQGERLTYTQGANVGKDVVMHNIKFVCFKAEDPNVMYDRLTANLDWVDKGNDTWTTPEDNDATTANTTATSSSRR